MKKEVMFFFIFLLFLPITFAQTKIFSGKVITDTDKVIDGGIFRFRYDEVSNKVFVQTPATGMIVENGACKSNNFYRVCIDRANLSYKNITTYVYYYEIDAIIYKLTGSLSTTGKATPNTLLQNEPTEFKITITNPTDFDITSIVFNYDLSPFFIKELKDCSLDGKQIKWQGSLKPKYDKTCTATIIPEKEGTFSLVGNLNYFNGYETEKKTTDTLTVKVLPKQLKVSYITDKNIEVKQPFHINTSLQNINKEEKIEATITIELPSNIKLLKNVPGFSSEFNTLRSSLKLEPNIVHNYSLYLEAIAESQNPIRHKFDYSIKGINDKIENNTFINPVEPKPIINFTSYSEELTPGQEFIIIAKMKNPSRIHKMTDIKARLVAPYNKEIIRSFDKIEPNESYSIISNTLVLPKELFEDKISIDLNVEYKFSDVIKSLNKSFELKIKKELMTTNITTTTNKTDVQVVQELTRETVAETSNKTTQQVTPIVENLSLKEELKSVLLDKRVLLVLAVVFVLILIIPFIIYKIRKRKKELQQPKNF